MEIGIDARPLIEKKSGIGIYVKNILDEILKFDKENQYILLSDSNIYYETESKNVIYVNYPKLKHIPSTFFYEYRLGHYLRKSNIHLDVFWGTQQFIPFDLEESCYKVITIHDLAYKICPETVNKKIRFMMCLFAKKSLRVSDSIIAVSKYTKDKLLGFYPDLISKQIKVIYESGNINEFSTNKIRKNRKFFLFIGNIEPRKNIEILLDAFEIARMKNNNIELCICGKYGWSSQGIINRMHTIDGVEYLNYVSDEKKLELLNCCTAFVMPSIYEGFGIPVVEALQSNKVVIVADNSSLREIVENPDLRFMTSDSTQLANIMLRLVDDSDFYKMSTKYCSERGRCFSWIDCARETQTVLTQFESSVLGRKR